MNVIQIVMRDEQQRSIWRLTKEVTDLFADLSWVLIGGLMVQVLEAQQGVNASFATGDVDAVLDVRGAVPATELAAARLLEAGFEPKPEGENLTYRFVRGVDIVDVLAPDHLGKQTSIRTVPPASTLEALGSRQALNRRRLLRVDAGDGLFDLPVPTLISAIVIKARVVGSAAMLATRQKHERDLARLLALVNDPIAERSILTAEERGYLRARDDMLDTTHRAWQGVAPSVDGAAALQVLGDISRSR